MKSVRVTAPLLLALACALPLRAAGKKAIESAFNQAYAGKTVLLRTFHNGRTLHYSATGNFIKGGEPGPWTLDAYIKIKEAKLKGNELLFKGNRLDFIYSIDDRKFDSVVGPKVSVAFNLGPASTSISSINKAVTKVFTGNGQKLTDLVADYWKAYLSHSGASLLDLCEFELPLLADWKTTTPSRDRKDCAELGWNTNFNLEPPNPFADKNSPKPAGKQGFTPPVALFEPQPPYTPEAREAKLHGAVVLMAAIAADGRVGKVLILKPLGMGLDDEAVKKVRTWKFKPAMRDGKPIPEAVTITVHFLSIQIRFTTL